MIWNKHNAKLRRTAALLGGLIGGVTTLGLGGCSSLPDSLNPSEWWRQGGRIVNEDTSNPAPGADAPKPNLGSVPARPARPDIAQQRAIADGLVTDRNRANYSEDLIRRPNEPPRAPPPRPASATAPIAAVGPSRVEQQAQSGSPIQTGIQPGPASARPLQPVLAPIAAPTANSATAQVAAAQDAPRSVPVRPTQPDPASPPGGLNSPFGTPSNTTQPQLRNDRPPGEFVSPFGPVTPESGAAPVGGSASPAPAPTRASTPTPAPTPAPARAAAGSGIITQVATLQLGGGLGNEERQILRSVAQLYQQRGGGIRLIGHTSAAGRDPDRNQQALLSESRTYAQNAARELQRLGVPASAIESEGRGAFQQLYDDSTRGGSANRRVEVFLVN